MHGWVYQVFVSSTYSDLKDERRQVSETLAKAGFIPAGMELFPAADQEQLEFIQRVIDRCDYYVVIVGGRYGSLADENVSFTEKEYDYALSKGIPILAFLHGTPEKIEVGKTDVDAIKVMKLKAFRDRLSAGRLVRQWNNVHDLRTEVLISLVNESNRRPGIGWVRGDQAIDPKVLQEAERLRGENSNLRKRLADIEQDEITFPESLASPDDQIEMTIEATVSLGKGRIFPQTQLESKTVTMPMRLIFINIFDILLTDPSENHLRSAIGTILANVFLKDTLNSDADYSLRQEDIHRLRFQFEALGLIRAIGGEYLGDNFKIPYIAWEITDKGRRYVTQSQAIRRSSSSAAIIAEPADDPARPVKRRRGKRSRRAVRS